MTERRQYGSGSVIHLRGRNLWRATLETGAAGRKRWQATSRTREGALSLLADRKTAIGFVDPPPICTRREMLADAQALGTHTRDEMNTLRRNAPAACPYCDVALNPFNEVVDHRWSIATGGSDAIDNLQVICWQCNAEKGDIDDYAYSGPRPRLFRPIPIREAMMDKIREARHA